MWRSKSQDLVEEKNAHGSLSNFFRVDHCLYTGGARDWSSGKNPEDEWIKEMDSVVNISSTL